jgi:transcriptional regulator with XRE-family HTH domain
MGQLGRPRLSDDSGNNPLAIEIGKRTRHHRKQRKLTQKELAKLANLSPKTVGEVERGESNPTLDVLHRLANALERDLFAPLTVDKGCRLIRRGLRLLKRTP